MFCVIGLTYFIYLYIALIINREPNPQEEQSVLTYGLPYFSLKVNILFVEP